MPNNKRGRPKKRGSKQNEVVTEVNGFELRPSSYQPTKAELEEDLSVPVSLEELAKAALSGGAKRKA